MGETVRANCVEEFRTLIASLALNTLLAFLGPFTMKGAVSYRVNSYWGAWSCDCVRSMNSRI